MSEWRHEPWDAEVTLFRRREDGTERGLYGWTEITAYLNTLEEHKALAERAEQMMEDENRDLPSDAYSNWHEWRQSFKALKAQEES